MAVNRQRLLCLADGTIGTRLRQTAAACLTHFGVKQKDGNRRIRYGDAALIRKYQQRGTVQQRCQRRERHERAACRTAMQQRGKAVAEHVNTDQQRQDLQGSQCADADGRVLQNIEHDRKRQCLKARCKAEIRGSCGKDQHQQRPERQNARTAACRVHSHLGIDQLDIFLFLGLIGGNACRSCLLARDACLAACFLGSGFFHDLLLLGSLLGSFLFCQLGLAACLPLGDLLRGPALTLFHFLLARRDARFARFFNRLVFGGGCGLCGLLCRFILLISGSRLWLLCLGLCRRCGLRLDRLFRLCRCLRHWLCRLCGRLTGHLGDDGIQIKFIGIRYVAEHIFQRFQIHIVFSIHVHFPLNCPVCVGEAPQTAAQPPRWMRSAS